MGPPVSRGVSRAPRYSGAPRPPSTCLTGLSPSLVGFSNPFVQAFGVPRWCPQPRAEARFGLIRLRSPLLTDSWLLSFPLVTKMFQFTRFASVPYTFRHGFPKNREGFPIRRSQDHSLVASSSGHIAGSHVLHRLLTPSHPPHALCSLITPTEDRQPRRTKNYPPRHRFSRFDLLTRWPAYKQPVPVSTISSLATSLSRSRKR